FFRYKFRINRRVLTLIVERQNCNALDLWKWIVNLIPLISDREQRTAHTAEQEEQKDWGRTQKVEFHGIAGARVDA
ncbi:MAG: hypothetical protein ACPHJ3_03260, partial [Rubripirellula sp.]